MDYRSLPSVDRILKSAQVASLIAKYNRPLVLQAIRESINSARAIIQNGKKPLSEDAIIGNAELMLETWLKPTLVQVINATGVVIHTNLGRAPLSKASIRALEEVAIGYSSLEYVLEKGSRGKREMHSEQLLRRLTGAEAALVVNNNAAAVLLALTALAKRKSVLISRSQLIEIGGGFRIPDVMKQSGAKLVEVGTTNRTHIDDFKDALDDRSSLLFLAHHSNF